MSFAAPDRLHRSAEFIRLQRNGARFQTRHFVMYAGILDSDAARTRLGVTVSRRIGNAVVRNRVKRRVREIFRTNMRAMLPAHSSVVVIARAWRDCALSRGPVPNDPCPQRPCVQIRAELLRIRARGDRRVRDRARRRDVLVADRSMQSDGRARLRSGAPFSRLMRGIAGWGARVVLDSSRVLLAVILSIILVVAYQELVLKRFFPPPTQQQQEAAQQAKQKAEQE